MFDINSLDSSVTIKIVNNTKVYIKDNFYKNPIKVLEFILSQPRKQWKSWDTPSYNGIHFLDQRHDFYDSRLLSVSKEIEKLCGETVAQPEQIVTNCMTFYDKKFNNYSDNYWAPHTDLGYTALIYLNQEDCEGTNFYQKVCEDPWHTPEHYEPWRSSHRYKLVDMVQSRFNRMVLFNGASIVHGMSVNSNRFFNSLRINQAIFLKP